MSIDLKAIFTQKETMDDKSLSFLLNALEKANLPNFDYLEFKKFLSALDTIHMDEATAYRSAFATAATLGLTKDKLLDSSNHYLNVLKNEKGKFDLALQNQLEQRIESQKQKIQDLNARIDQSKRQIAELNAQIQKDQGHLTQINSKIEEAKEKIDETREMFESTLQSLVRQIQNDQETFKKVL